MKKILVMFIAACSIILYAEGIRIVDKPIDFDAKRIALTKSYIAYHYGKKVNNIKIKPKIIVLHWTGSKSFQGTYNYFKPAVLRGRKDIMKASALNVSAHYMVDRDGTIYRLMPDNWMARHVIGLNYNAIGIENVGGVGGKEDLTDKQLKSNIALVKYLKKKYPDIEYLIGHLEYRGMEKTALWLERDKNYRTGKSDPGPKFTRQVRNGVKMLHLKDAPNGKTKSHKQSAKH